MNSEDESFDKKLILLIEGLPHLWDRSIAEYKDKRMRENAWKSLGRLLDIPAADVERRWKLIRDRFARIKRLNNNIPSGASSSQASQNAWDLYSSLSFLNPHVQTRKSIGNISKSSTQRTTFADDNDSEQDGEIEYLDEDVLQYLNAQHSLDDNADQPQTNQSLQASKRLTISQRKPANQLCQNENVPPVKKATNRNINESNNPPQKRAKITTEHLENAVMSALKNVQETFAETNVSMKEDAEFNFCMSVYGSLKQMNKKQRYCV